MTPTFTVLIGSIGRETLMDTLNSIARQRRVPGDQCLVGIDTFEDADGNREKSVTALVQSYGEGFHAIPYNSGYHFFGVEQINHVLRTVRVTGSHVFTVGDDDVFVDGAYNVLRPICEREMSRPVIYQFLAPWREILPNVHQMQRSRVSGCCIAAPAKFVGPMDTKTQNPDGSPYVEHDFDWMQNIIRESGQEPIWLDEVLVIARPEQRVTGKARGHHDVTHQGIVRCWRCQDWRFAEDVPLTEVHCPRCHVVLPVRGVRERVA